MTSPSPSSTCRSLSVAVIGAGAAGLVTARELVREGHRVTVFEQSARVGGVWNYSPDFERDDPSGRNPKRGRVHSSMYESLRTNLPREIMSFSDFPFTAEAMGKASTDPRRFPCHQEVEAFLEVFADEFDVRKLIEFRTRVVKAEPVFNSAPSASRSKTESPSSPESPESLKSHDGPSGEGPLPWWRVTTGPVLTEAPINIDEDKIRVREFDAVVSCVGNYSEPNVPEISGMDSFPGQQLHVHNFRRDDAFPGGVVLVVGASFSGEEIARRVAVTAEKVYLCARTWPPVEIGEPRSNVVSGLPMVETLHKDGSITLQGGEVILRVDAVIYCTGYRYSYPWLGPEAALSTEDGRVEPLYRHIFPPILAPTLSFVGLIWKSIRNCQFELQATYIARMLSGRLSLPSEDKMREEILHFYESFREAGLPLRYIHCQTADMPESSWEYNDKIADECGIPRLQQWRRDLYGNPGIFSRPDSFRDTWTEEEKALFEEAASDCAAIYKDHLQRKLKLPSLALN